MRRWFSGDERTLAVFLVGGVLTMAFFRLDLLRTKLGITDEPGMLLLVVTALAWWSLLPRSFVWLDPADLTWRDFGGVDRVALIGRRLTTGWLVRLLALGYVLALFAALAAAPWVWITAGAAVLVGAGVLALAVVRRPRTAPTAEALTVLALAVVVPAPPALFAVGAVLALAGIALIRPGPPPVADVGRPGLVDGWRERVLRVSGVQFLDLALLLPPARPTRAGPLTGGVRLAVLGVAGRVRHVPTAALLGIAAVATHRAFPALPEIVVFGIFGYLALVPLTAGLGELWRSPGRRRWVGASDTALRWHHFVVATLLAVVWGVPVWLLGGWDPNVLVAAPVLAACAVRTMTRKTPTYDNLVPVDTPMGTMPVRLIMQTLRGPDLGLLAWVLTFGLPPWGVALVAGAAVSLALFR
ncbi:hypothetical protein [Actinophytocola sp.]|uniref:hypothetical protein n=1 Tax=Actinophytocola sp. TaxID=1872138 RepID=UPI002ED1CDDD